MAELPIRNGFYISDSLPMSHQECTNFFVNIPQAPSLSEANIFGIPGTTQVATSGAVQQENRGGWRFLGKPYFVNGNKLYRLDQSIAVDGTISYSLVDVSGSTIIESTGLVFMVSNPTQLLILVPGGKGYIYTVAGGLVEITDPNFIVNGQPIAVTFVDGYFVFTTDDNKVIISALNNGLVYDATDVGTAESDPDETVAPAVVSNQLYITGRITTEGFRNVGGSGYPFSRNNVFMDKGCLAAFSLVKISQSYLMVGRGQKEDPAIWMFENGRYRKVSTIAIDNVLADYDDTEISEAFGWYYAQKGHHFAGFTFTDRTFVYDLSTQLWHERKSTIEDEQTRWRVNSIVQAYGKIFVGDMLDGRIGLLDTDTYGEYGDEIQSCVSIQPLYSIDGYEIPTIELVCESGVGNDDYPDPQISMEVSRDGKTWTEPKMRSLGKVGEFNLRQVWRQSGRVERFATLRFKISAQVKKAILRLEAR